MSNVTTQQPQPSVIAPPAITLKQLEDQMRALKGNTFVTILTRVEPKMRKTDNPFWGKVFKISRVNCCIGFHYSNSVNNQRKREGTDEEFVAKPRAWGERIEGTPLVSHKEKLYLETKVERSLGHTYVWETGDPLSDDEVRELTTFLSVSKQAATQQTEKEIVL